VATIKCTQRLLRRLALPSNPGPADAPRNRLGDWYANLVYARNLSVVVFVSERTLLPLVIRARGLDGLPALFEAALREMLEYNGIPLAAIDSEFRHTMPLAFGRTSNRSVLGSLNDFAYRIRYMLAAAPQSSLFDVAAYIANMPCEPISWATPGEFARRALVPREPLKWRPGGAA
jgi:hypothetical protein